MNAVERGSRVPDKTLTRHLSAVFQSGYWICLVLVALGVVLPYVASERLGVLAIAGIMVLLATPAVAALWVGVVALIRRDWRLVFVATGIILLLAAWVLLQLT